MKPKMFLTSICSFFICNQFFSQSNITYERGTLIDIGTGADVCADAIIINGTFSGEGSICRKQRPVLLSSFTSSVRRDNVCLSWTAIADLNNAGFDIERCITRSGAEEWQKIAFVPGNGTSNTSNSYVYIDKKLQTGSYRYRVKQIDFNGNYEYHTLESDVVIAPPNIFSISQNYPNPSNPKSKIDYEIPVEGKVTIKLYDILGKEAVSIVNETKLAGYYSAEFDGKELSSGIYFYRIVVEGNALKFSKTLKMVLVK